MDLLGHYSNHDLQGSLRRLAGKLASVRANGGRRRRPVACRQRARRPGWVLKAVVEVLADRREPMRAKDIHAAVEALVGERVPRSSVKGALASDVAGSGATGPGGARALRAGRGTARSSIIWNSGLTTGPGLLLSPCDPHRRKSPWALPLARLAGEGLAFFRGAGRRAHLSLGADLACEQHVRARVVALPATLDRPRAVVGDHEAWLAHVRPERHAVRTAC